MSTSLLHTTLSHALPTLHFTSDSSIINMMSAPLYHTTTSYGAKDENIWQRMCDYICRLSKQHNQSPATRFNTIALMARMRNDGITQEEMWATMWLSSKLFESVDTQLTAYKLKRRHQVARHVMTAAELHVFQRCGYQMDARFESFETYIELLIQCIHTQHEQDQEMIQQELISLTDPLSCLIHIAGSSSFLASYPHDALAASIVVAAFHMMMIEYGHICDVSPSTLRSITLSLVTCFTTLLTTSRHTTASIFYPDMHVHTSPPGYQYQTPSSQPLTGHIDDTHGLSHLTMSTPHVDTHLYQHIIKYANSIIETALGKNLYKMMEMAI